MLELFTALYTFFQAQTTADFYTAIAGELHYQKAKAGLRTYAVFSAHPFFPEHTFDAKIFDGVIQFNIFTPDFESSLRICGYCETLFDGVELTVSGHEKVTLYAGEKHPAYQDGMSDFDLWQSVIEFSFKLQK